ncbi:hypothetical protein [Comamonas piscis]
MIACTKSFDFPVEVFGFLIEAVSEYASCGAEKLRRPRDLAGQVQICAQTIPLRLRPTLHPIDHCAVAAINKRHGAVSPQRRRRVKANL